MSAPQARNSCVMAGPDWFRNSRHTPPGQHHSHVTGVDWPVVGRDDELAAISARLRRGVGCVVAGEPGVGKTASPWTWGERRGTCAGRPRCAVAGLAA
jgi:hypothetical protein